MKEKAIKTACDLCDCMMHMYEPEKLPPEKIFHYHQGVFLSGMYNTFDICKEKKYFDYIKAWVDSIIWDDGSIHDYDKTRLDDLQPGILLFGLYEATGEEKYKKVLNEFAEILKGWPKNNLGGFWHKYCHPNQMWLDSLYMDGPIQAMLAKFNDDESFMNEAANQALIMFEKLYDKKSGLMFHAWDETGAEEWCSGETNCSPEIWGRAMGWYVVALADILELMPDSNEKKKKLVEIERCLLEKIADYREETTKMWYQIVNKGDLKSNWLETSCSCLFTAAIAKAVRLGIIDGSYRCFANDSFKGLEEKLIWYEGHLYVSGICVGTGVGDYRHYINRPTVNSDLHGVGAFLLMCAEIYKIN